jgi:hypothetical protein
VHAAGIELGEKELQFAIADQGVSTDEGDMQRLLAVHNRKNFLNEVVAFKVGELPQICFPTQMSCIKRITARATKGALLGDLN